MKDKSFWMAALKDNWYLLACLAALPIGAAVVVGGSGSNASPAGDSAAHATSVDASPAAVGDHPSSPFKLASGREDKARNAILRYEQEIRKNPNSEETPLLLMRMGNLYYASMQDYENAIQKFELLMNKFPDFNRIKDIYPSLAECYGRTGQTDLQRNTYRRMLEIYPEDSEHHKFAAEQLKPAI